MGKWGLLGLTWLLLLAACQPTYTSGESGEIIVLGSQNFFAETPPKSFCGRQGYEFLLRNYTAVHCAGCHGADGFAYPKFAEKNDLNLSYGAALSIPEDDWIRTLTANKFCGDDCSLDERGEVYQAFVEWLESPEICP